MSKTEDEVLALFAEPVTWPELFGTRHRALRLARYGGNVSGRRGTGAGGQTCDATHASEERERYERQRRKTERERDRVARILACGDLWHLGTGNEGGATCPRGCGVAR